MHKSLIFAAFVLTSPLLFVAPSTASACDPAPPTPRTVVPVNGDRVPPTTQLFVVGDGQLPADSDIRLTDRAGNPVDVDAEVYARAGLFQWAAVYAPTTLLSATAYDFFASYSPQSDNPQTITTSFQVQDSQALSFERPTIASWARASFDPAVAGQCESYSTAVRLVLKAPTHGDSPLWYKVELTGGESPDTSTYALVPGLADDDGATLTRVFHDDVAADCVRVTPVGPSGGHGDTVEDCQPAKCQSAAPGDVHMDTLWDEMPECQTSVQGDGGDAGGSSSGGNADSGCSVTQPERASRTPWVALLGLVVIAGIHRRLLVRSL